MRKNFSNSRYLFLVALLPFLLVACKTSQKTVSVPEQPVILEAQPSDSLFAKVMQHPLRFDWLTAKASVDYTDADGDEKSFNVSMRCTRDSAIWLSVTPPVLGIEVVRTLITRDSLYLLDRLHHIYIVRDYGYLEDLLKTRVTFESLQALLTGNYFSGIEGRPVVSIYEESPYYILSTLPKQQPVRSAEARNPAHPQVQDYWIDPTYRIARTRIEDHGQQRAMVVNYSGFTQHGESWFPMHILLNIESAKPTRINIEYSKINFDGPLSFPFYVPEKFSRE